MMKNFLRTLIFFLCALVVIPTTVFARVSNDPEVEQWAFQDTGVFTAWDRAVGSRDVVVAIIDNGFDTFHPDLRENIWINEDEIPDNFIDDDHNGYIDDLWGWNFAAEDRNGDGIISPDEELGNNDPRPSVTHATELERREGAIHHGTLVAGIIGAVGNNGAYGSGINWRVRLMNVKVLGNKGNGELHRLGEAIRYAVDNGADIINFSVVGSAFTRDIREAIEYAYEHGVAMAAAAGNNLQFLNETPFYPICADKVLGKDENRVIGVSAIDEPHTIAIFSNTGSDCVDITAPGVNVFSTMRYDPAHGFTAAYGGGWNGTSFATPIVSGALALLKSIQPHWKASQLYNALLTTTHKTPPEKEKEYAHLFGNGLVQIDKAVAFALEQKVQRPFIAAIGWVDPVTGVVYTYDNETGDRGQQEHTLLRNSIAVRAYHTQTAQGYVVARRIDAATVEVNVLSSSWALQSSWRTSLRGDVAFAVGDVHAQDGLEIILASDHDDTISIHGFDGVAHATIPIHKQKVPISLATILGNDGLEDIVAVYRFNEAMTLHRFSGEGRLTRLIPLRNLSSRSVIETGDIDGDGTQEIIIAGGQGEEPVLMYVKEDGTLLRALFAYEPGMRTGLQLLVRDYTVDFSDNPIVIPKDGSDRVRVWQDTRIVDQPHIAPGGIGFLIPILQ